MGHRATDQINLGLYFPHICEDQHVGVTLVSTIATWLQKHPKVNVVQKKGYPFLELSDLNKEAFDGLLCFPETKTAIETIKGLGKPTISLAEFHRADDLPHVREDNEAIGRLAGEYFLKRGFHHFGIINRDDAAWSACRETGYRAALVDAASEIYKLDGRGFGKSWYKDWKRIAAWLQRLPRPIAIMANTDRLGRVVIGTAMAQGAHVPRDIAVLGVGNSLLECCLAKPTLSSISLDLGNEIHIALDTLVEMIQRGARLEKPVLVPPLAIVSRESTEVYCFEDARMNAVVEFIRRKAISGIGIEEVLKKFPMSRRTLETRFKALVGRSPYEEIQAIQVNVAGKHLRETQLSLTEIAELCGFTDVNHLGRVFRTRVGKSPSQFRKEASKP